MEPAPPRHGAPSTDAPPLAPTDAPLPLPLTLTPPPPLPATARSREAPKESNPADEQYETLKRHIHMHLVDRLDLNRITEMDPNTLRSEIRERGRAPL